MVFAHTHLKCLTYSQALFNDEQQSPDPGSVQHNCENNKRRNSLQAFACDEQMRLGHPEDVVYGSGCQDLSHGLIDDVRVLGGLHLHAAQEPNDEKLVQDRV